MQKMPKTTVVPSFSHHPPQRCPDMLPSFPHFSGTILSFVYHVPSFVHHLSIMFPIIFPSLFQHVPLMFQSLFIHCSIIFPPFSHHVPKQNKTKSTQARQRCMKTCKIQKFEIQDSRLLIINLDPSVPLD